MIKISVEQAVKDLRREFVDLTNGEFNKGIARSINRTLSGTRTTASKEIRAIYNLSAGDVRKSMSVDRAKATALTGKLKSEGRLLSLTKFKPVMTSDGVSIEIKKGHRTTIKGAFTSPASKLNGGIYARGNYVAKDFQFRHQRVRPAGGYKKVGNRMQPVNNDLAIDKLRTLSIPQTLQNKTVLTVLSKKMEEDFPKRLVHELKWIRKKG